MMDQEYLDMLNDITNDEEYQKLKCEKHHGINRFEHSMRVAKRTYIVTKRRKMNYKEATRAAFLHDYFFSFQTTTDNIKGAYKHPIFALENSKKRYQLSAKESNIIRSHMFPLSKELPRSREAWIVTRVDKSIALYEFFKFKFKPLQKLRKSS